MSTKVSPYELERRATLVKRAMKHGQWMRPIEVANATGLRLAAALAALRLLQKDHLAERQTYVVPRFHVGKDRIRKTSREVIEYRLLAQHKTEWPSWMMPTFTPPPGRVTATHRLAA